MIAALLVNYRLPLIILLNAALTFIGYLVALCLRFDFAQGEIFTYNRLWIPVGILLVLKHGSYIFWGLNKGYWRYASTHDFIKILKAHALTTLLFAASVLLFRLPGFPRSVIFIEFAFSLLLSGGSRLLVRIACEQLLFNSPSLSNGNTRDIIIIGAGDSGHLVIKNFKSQRRLLYNPVAVLDDSERKQGGEVYEVPVLGRINDLEKILKAYPNIAAVIVAIPTLSNERFSVIENVCKSFNIPVKRLQSFEDIACIDAMQPQGGISVESILEKEREIEHEEDIRRAISGRRVLVTGAGGSIGSELVRQLLQFGPSSLVMLDNGEYNLFKIDREVRQNYPAVRKRAVLCSITDERRLKSVFDDERPEVVFHAAAFKHVPLMEENPQEAILNNIIGTRNLLNVSYERKIARFVMISTDKAVAPCSVMGATKRISEMLLQAYAQRDYTAQQDSYQFSAAAVRFGNVINSNGSVIPIFKEQILSGGPLTVTHPEMERYFMSIREAVRLVLTAGTLGESGEIYVLDMGTPIKIVDVAKKMLALFGRRDIQIVFTGIRPGEKLREEFSDSTERSTPTRFAKINQLMNEQVPAHLILDWIKSIEDRIYALSEYEIRTEIAKCLLIGRVRGANIKKNIAINS